MIALTIIKVFDKAIQEEDQIEILILLTSKQYVIDFTNLIRVN